MAPPNTAFLGVGNLGICKVATYEILTTDPQTNILSREQNPGILIISAGGGGSFYPGIYSLSRDSTVKTIFEASKVTSITCTTSTITIEKESQGRATVVWIPINY